LKANPEAVVRVGFQPSHGVLKLMSIGCPLP
jgi:hypothetical protein